ncbi:hypothetical protein Trydic_g16414 [Trypoxylus dichotomus]
MAYVDDLATVVESKDQSVLMFKTNETPGALVAWMKELKLKIAHQKTETHPQGAQPHIKYIQKAECSQLLCQESCLGARWQKRRGILWGSTIPNYLCQLSLVLRLGDKKQSQQTIEKRTVRGFILAKWQEMWKEKGNRAAWTYPGPNAMGEIQTPNDGLLLRHHLHQFKVT